MAKMKMALVVGFALAAVLLFLALPHWVFERAPMDVMLYVNQKIFYYHVPAALMMFLSVFVCGGASIGFLVTRKPVYDDVAASAGDLVVMFGLVMLTTGPIWARAAWGVYWVWEARLTLSLLLWMIFMAYALTRRYGGPGSERLAAGLAMFGMVNVPMVYMAVNFWKTQHPTTKVIPGLQGEMKAVFGDAVLAYFCFWVVVFAARLVVARGERRLSVVHDLALENGYLD